VNSQRIVSLARWTLATAALAGIVTVYQRWLHVNPTTVALTLLLFILMLAAKWGLRYAVAVSIAATVCYNYYFLPPVRTFTISDPQNWLALLAFLATAVIASRLSDRIREEALQAKTRQAEVEVLFQLSRELLQTDQVADLINAVPNSIVRVSGASAVLLFLAEGQRVYRSGVARVPFAPAEDLAGLMAMPAPTSLEDGRRIAIPLRAGVKPRGVLILEGLHLSDETYDAIGGLVSVAIDRAQALEEVTRGEAAKESDRLRGVMLDSITHELRTPLTSIKAAVSTLLSSENIGQADTRELLTVIDEESDRLNHLVGQAVEMARLDTREINMRISAQTIASLLDGIKEECSGFVTNRDVRIEIPAGLPCVQADPVWIRKVLCNLLDNAAKYSPADQPIIVSAEQKGAEVDISVADRGIGIDSMEQPMIFDKFYRSQSQIERIPGTGMGLAISRAILEAHGGTISVTSQLGQGSVFTFSLPVAEEKPTRG
jgi:two-component system sensor histidine kinase KdpD